MCEVFHNYFSILGGWKMGRKENSKFRAVSRQYWSGWTTTMMTANQQIILLSSRSNTHHHMKCSTVREKLNFDTVYHYQVAAFNYNLAL
jgi:hypothetical protein